MPSWYFSKEDLAKTPSRLNGIDVITEDRYRREGARFIMDLGNKLGLRFDAMATGMVYFHRFYMIQSFKSFPRWVTATACLFLAGKVEETPKKCRDIIKATRSIFSDRRDQAKMDTFGEDPREEVMIYERILLQTIKFDLQVEHPYPHLLKMGKALKGDRDKMNKLVQMAWTFINDSMTTTICLRYRPDVIALALLMLAGKLSKHDMQSCSPSQSHKPWYSMFVKDVSGNVLEDICDEMLELYGGKKKEKEKELLSDGSASNTSSPSVPSSPPIKKKRPPPPSESKLASTPAPPGTSSQPPPPPLPPQTQSLQVENISPAVTPAQTTTAATSQSSLTTDMRQSYAITCQAGANTIPTISSQRAQTISTAGKSDYGYATLNPTFLSAQSRVLSNTTLSSATLATSASFLTTTTSNYSLPPPHIPLQATYIPPVDYSRPPPPVMPSASATGFSVPPPTESLYAIPMANLTALKNQQTAIGLPNQSLPLPPLPSHQSLGLPPPRPLPPPPMPPIPNPAIPPPGHVAATWPQRFGGPPPTHGGWMR